MEVIKPNDLSNLLRQRRVVSTPTPVIPPKESSQVKTSKSLDDSKYFGLGKESIEIAESRQALAKIIKAYRYPRKYVHMDSATVNSLILKVRKFNAGPQTIAIEFKPERVKVDATF